MKYCKNKECKNSIIESRTYCSLTCRNVYVNKHLRDYKIIGKSISKNAKNRYKPKKCKYSECINLVSYERRKGKSGYCSKECSSKCYNLNRKGIKYIISEERLLNLKQCALNNFYNSVKKRPHSEEYINYENNPNVCLECDGKLIYKFRKRKYCCIKCRREFERKNMTDYVKYKQDCKFKFHLKDFPEEFNFELIKKYGWYKPTNRGNNLKGISRDHILSVREGFEGNIDSKLISHPANCKLMIHSENISKNKKSNLIKEELIEKINVWNMKYKDNNY